jgi:cytochrome b561
MSPSLAVGNDMLLRDTPAGYGLISRALHWLMGIAIVAMFVLGLYMVGLDYYSPYYNSAPDLHRAVGMILFALLLVRMLWRVSNTRPRDDELSRLEWWASRAVHWSFYALLLVLSVSGYLISTADGAPVSVFGIEIPAITKSPGLETPAGNIHRVVAYAVMALVVVHTLAALKHHFIDKDSVMTRMWSGPQELPPTPQKETEK